MADINEKVKSMALQLEQERKHIPQPLPSKVGSGGTVSKIYRAKTQEAAQSDAYISVKLLNRAGTEIGSAFDATCIFSDAATAANACSPLIASGKTILITLVDGTWYIVNPTLAEMGTASSDVSSSSTTIFGRTMYQIGEW